MANKTDGYKLADEVFDNIRQNTNHDISLTDMIRVLSFWGYNEEADCKGNKIGFVCYCARLRLKQIIEQALVWGDCKQFRLLSEMITREAEND